MSKILVDLGSDFEAGRFVVVDTDGMDPTATVLDVLESDRVVYIGNDLSEARRALQAEVTDE